MIAVYCVLAKLQSMKILGISLSEFHDKAGFQLVTSVPQVTVLTKEQFNLCSDLILPRQQLCGRLLALQFKQDYFLVVKPLLSKNKDQDKTYKRQKYIYSISVLVNKCDYLDKIKQPLYKQTVAKIANFFKVIEEKDHIVYFNQKYMPYIASKLTYIFKDINEQGACNLTYQCHYFTFLNINRPPNQQQKCQINQSSVPVTLLTEEEIQQIQSDLARQLLWYAYKGTFTLKKICKLHPQKKEAELSIFYKKAAEKGLVFMLDMINLSNVYVLTQKIIKYVSEEDGGSTELRNIAKIINTSSEEIDPHELLCLYLQFTRVTTLAKIIEVNRKLVSRMDITKFIRMGQIHGFIVRLYQKITYSQFPSPLIMADPLRKLLAQRQNAKLNITQKFLQQEMQKMSDAVKTMLTNNSTVDEMMVSLDVDCDRLLSLLSNQNRYLLQINDE